MKLESGETIITVVRKHIIVLLLDALGLILLLLVPLVAWYLLSGRPIETEVLTVSLSASSGVTLMIFALWTLILWILFFIRWTDYYLDNWKITNRRLINTDQKGFFTREVSSLAHAKIQDVTIEVNGIIATLFNFGDVHVQTAAEMREFVIRNVPRPKEVKQEIMAQMREVREDS